MRQYIVIGYFICDPMDIQTLDDNAFAVVAVVTSASPIIVKTVGGCPDFDPPQT